MTFGATISRLKCPAEYKNKKSKNDIPQEKAPSTSSGCLFLTKKVWKEDGLLFVNNFSHCKWILCKGAKATGCFFLDFPGFGSTKMDT